MSFLLPIFTILGLEGCSTLASEPKVLGDNDGREIADAMRNDHEISRYEASSIGLSDDQREQLTHLLDGNTRPQLDKKYWYHDSLRSALLDQMRGPRGTSEEKLLGLNAGIFLTNLLESSETIPDQGTLGAFTTIIADEDNGQVVSKMLHMLCRLEPDSNREDSLWYSQYNGALSRFGEVNSSETMGIFIGGNCTIGD